MKSQVSSALVIVVTGMAAISIAISLYTNLFIMASLSLPVVSGGVAVAICLRSKGSRQRFWLLASIAFLIPAICSWICWSNLLRNFIT